MSLETITIEDATSGSRAKITPGVGFNCYSFSVPSATGAIECLWSAPDWTSGGARPSGSGIPLMFPFAGRIRGTSFAYGGKQFELTAGDGQGNAIHGFVIDRKWRVTRSDKSRASGEFQASKDDAALLRHWPADFRITADYQVLGTSLLADYTIESPGDRPLPFGFGTHPYFRIPLGGADGADCQVTVPVEYEWELVKLLPTGKQTSTVAPQLARGMKAGEMHLDHVFGGVRFENHRATARIADSKSKLALTMTFDDRFPTCVVYNPPHREAVCIEPYTTVPDAFWLADQGIDPHLQVLPPGGSFRTRIEIRLA